MQEKLTGKERAALLYLAALDDEIHKASPILRPRLNKLSRTAWRDWRLMQSLSTKLLTQMVDTLTDKDVRWLGNMLENGKMGIELPGPLVKPDYLIVDARDMAEIGRMAARKACTLCLKGRKDAEKCRLRKCLQNIAPMPDGDTMPDELSSCEYSQVDWNSEIE